MKIANRILLLAIIIAVVAIVFNFISYSSRGPLVLNAPFSATEAFFEVTSERAVFKTRITNDGLNGLVLNEIGLDNSNCVSIMPSLTLGPGESFDVVISCPGLTEEEIRLTNLYIISTPVGTNVPQLTTETGVGIPNTFSQRNDIPPFLTTSGGSGGSGGGGSTGNSNSQTNPGSIVAGALGSATLATPDFISVTPGGDNTPTVHFFTTVPYCRMGVVDVGYFDMPSGNICIVDTNLGEGYCTLSQPLADGSHTLSVACSNSNTLSATAVYNGVENNLDVAVNIDTTSPVISSVNPNGGELGSGIVGVELNGDVSGAVSCSAGTYDIPFAHINPYVVLSVSVPISNNHFIFTAPLNEGNNYVVIVCSDSENNVARHDTDNFVVSAPPAAPLSGTTIPDTTIGQGESDDGGGGSPQIESVPDGPPSPPAGEAGGADQVGAVVRDFNSERSWFGSITDAIGNWFKGLFD